MRVAILVATAFSMTLTACSPGEEEAYDSAWVGDIERNVKVSGRVGQGPTVNAAVTIRNYAGEAIADFKSDASAHYEVDLAAREADFPLLIDAAGGKDLVTNTAPDFALRSAVFSSRERVTANVNPFSTIAIELASNLNGGLTRENLLEAERIVASSLNSGLTTLASSGPVQTPVGGTNIAELVKSSEVLAEIVRRTRDELNSAGYGVSADAVIEALGADLIDGVIEGNGGAGADPRTAAVANIVSAEVTLEALKNELQVDGVDVTDAMRGVIERLAPDATGPSLDELGATEGMIYQAAIGLEAAYEITADIAIAGVIQALDGVQPGMEPALVRPLLDADYSKSLDDAVSKTAKGDKSVVDRVNDLARSGGSRGGPKNRRPAISGQPPTAVQAGSNYDFAPTASDLDNDPLTFNIAAKPGWAVFDTSTGHLSGTPQVADAGTYEGITITVSDGELTNSLGSFAIEVSGGNAAPSISGTPSPTVEEDSSYEFTPTASDPDGDPLTFSISGRPAWATFDSLTGELSGTPGAGDVGLYPGIEITVSDGKESATLPAFSIEVVAASSATGAVTLSWTPPSQNEDGSQLTDLAAYRILWSRDGGGFNNSVRIDNPGITGYVVENLAPGTYEFVATAINSSGVESSFSNGVTRVVE
jgi:hypothetical protein